MASYPVIPCLAAIALLAPSAVATSFDFTTFPSLERLRLAGDAALHENALRLTPSEYGQVGSAWAEDPVSLLAGFDTTFRFRLTDFRGWPIDWSNLPRTGADGLAFVVQAAGPNPLGIYASGIGYMGIERSLAVEFDTWSNYPPLYCEPDDPHVSVHSMGTEPNRAEHCANEANGLPQNPDLGTAVLARDLSDGDVHEARISYVPGLLSIYVDDFEAAALRVSVDIAATIGSGQAWVGFTSSTGGAFENHDLLSWRFQQIPEPGTWVLAAAGLLLLCACRSKE